MIVRRLRSRHTIPRIPPGQAANGGCLTSLRLLGSIPGIRLYETMGGTCIAFRAILTDGVSRTFHTGGVSGPVRLVIELSIHQMGLIACRHVPLTEGRSIMKYRLIVLIGASIFALLAGTLPAFAASSAPSVSLKAQDSNVTLQSASNLITTPQPKSTVKSNGPNVTFYAIAVAEDPFVLTTRSKTIYAEGRITSTYGNPTACAIGVDLEEYDGFIKQWITAAHQPMVWGSCSGAVVAQYNCTYDPNIKWEYRTHIWLQAEKGSTYGNMGQAYSANNVKYWCS